MAADIVEVIGDHTRLKKAGRSWKGLCPFHNERTPSFTVDRDKGLYHCFGCGAGGDVIHFVRQIDRLEFPEAVEALAARFGVTIPRRERRGPRDDRRDRMFEAVAAARAVLPRAPRQAGQLGGEVSRAARRSEGALEGADARPRARRLGLDRPGAVPRFSREPSWSRRASSSRARRPRAPTTASATGSSSSCATSAAAPSASADAPSRPRASRST